MARIARGLGWAVSAASCVGLVACFATDPLTKEHEAASSEDVANVYVSAYPAVPWASIADKLEPKNNLSTADARTMAALTTQSQVSQVVSMLSGGLAIGLPGTTFSKTTTTDSSGTSVSTTKAISPGAVASSSGAAPVSITDATLAPDLSKNPFSNGVDANTQLMGGLGVYQLAQILDNQISKELLPKGYLAYLVTFQINLQPKRRDLPYDAYVNLTLMPGSWHKAIASSQDVSQSANELSPIIVYPLIVTDAMETSSVGRSVESIRQAGLALSGAIANVGVTAEAKKGRDELASLLGSDRNSLVTAGRVSDNTVRIRLGAQFEGSSKFAIVPRTQNVSVVVFTKVGKTEVDHLDKVAVITNTTFVNSMNGDKALAGTAGRREQLARDVRQSVTNYGFALNANCGNSEDPLDLPNNVLRAVDRQDYVYLSTCLLVKDGKLPRSSKAPKSSFAAAPSAPASVAECFNSNKCGTLLAVDEPYKTTAGVATSVDESFTPFEEAKLRRLVAELMTNQSDSRYSKLLVQLADFKSVTPHQPEDQLALLEDAKSGSKLTLRGASNIDRTKFKPILRVVNPGRTVTLYPTNVGVDASGLVTVGFPGIASSKLMKTVVTKATVKGKADTKSTEPPDSIELIWRYAKSGTDGTTAADLDTLQTYAVQLQSAEADPPGNPVSVTSTVLRPDSTSTAKLTVYVDKVDPAPKALVLRVANADIRGVDPVASLDASKKGLPVTPGTTVTLTLTNLSSAAPVTIKTYADGVQLGSAVTLPVEPVLMSSK